MIEGNGGHKEDSKAEREGEQPQPPPTKGGKKAASDNADDESSFVRDRYHEDVTEAIQMEEEEANARGGKKGKGRKKYRQATQDR